ncbi:ELKS/Rab6-interacting/CAST family member 1 isoform X9 [Canis lupus familiaris]|uniref:ELKS/Rab6-interacting/CAST family member 1 isoform X9 n=1 Tax=Canis lupus familiaris TaxID=9615 RepID=UPI00005A4D87|nr:ELKS/Rab6-interacting/CAST family member 1 isoform X9 [Canis lupus familiaris]XP_025317517.1 ELKS/Rab6-interacting/CAST family member 1 isoform X13 [Canis lupus dingo]XP_025851255.1 ELKS/Rab6-interacting/CAST family member 1 isoform X8 [Vulpes vulpes]XP_038295344.1 ELKS/Rab6-interacting/CAST family member 1 isoform X9 [Canis lupus familiaris]XP_038432294.1 ELKS/Rab6-interacting/CAST family member 1 isoform X9 [Canis lupus familiaris]XP_041592513.1 ELKS/Rab6-interacting/CAST family member 1 |eukprot:XP_005637402.1 ELKS/Rab6-interacting/CAST family member 1 isoform X12 [Canis lupus familiaris]
MYGSARSVGKVEPSNQSPGRSPRLPRSPRLGHRRTNSTGGSSGSSVGGGGGKTLSMENIQSLNAAYATSGPMYLSDHENVGSETPKSTMTLGRSGGRLPYGVRMTAMGSSPNIASSGVASDTIAFGEHHLPPVSMASTVPHSLRQARDNTIMDLQTQLKEVLRENDLLRKDVEVKESKLSSSMNSIKTFWSPELKKERALRKDEASKITIWKEQYRVVQEENQHMQMTIQALQDELRIQRDLNQLFQQDSSSRTGEPCVTELTEENFQRLHAEHERQAKELFLLRKTLEEMELRIETQKQTLNARDESIKKLLEMLQSKGLSAKATEEDHERTRRLAEAEMHVHHLESLLEQKEKENSMLREEMHRRFENAPDSAKTKALQTVIEMKDSKISSMERGLRDLEEEIQMLKSNGALSTEEREEEMKQMEVYRSHSKFMKNKIGQVKQELSRKDTELLALQTKLETLTNQFSDSKQHIEVLKESLTAKEQRAAILQTEVDALRLRLEEKETMLNKKTKQIQDMAEEKGTQAGEIHDLKDMLDVKERKVNVLQKKIENLQEQLRDKEKQMSSLKERVKSLQADTTNTDTALTTLEEALAEKERTIERLKEQRDRDEREKQEEIDNYKKDLKDLKEKVSLLQGDLSEKEASLLDLKEHASSLASSGLKKDSRLKTLEIALEQKKEECLKMESHLKKAHEATLEARASPEMSDRIQQLEREISRYKDESSKAQAEVDRLLEILKEVENEKNDKDKKIAELESLTSRQVKDQNKKVANLKHKEQVEKKKSAQMLEEARRREDNLNDSSQQLQDSLRKKDDRIEELEEALRESVQITAEREMVLAQEESARTSAEKQVEELLMAMEKVKQELESMKAKLSSTQQSLAEKETHLTNLRAERRKHLEEVLEMKQEALLAAISEKDANIALLELSSSKKKTQEEVAALKREKDRLVQQLKQQTQNRMKLMADNYEDDHFKSSHSNQTNHKPSPDQDEEEGIWA